MMSRRQNDEKKTKLLKRVRHQRLKHITILPSLITLLNGICGFAAIVFASKGVEQMSVRQIELPYFAWSGYMIFFAMIADMLDGRVARMSQTTSSFGGQLDSLCDMISFGVAPAFLMFKLVDHKLGELIGIGYMLEGFVYRFVWLASSSYMACAAIRLARFNVENEEDETAHMSFAGLPTPAAAGVPASLIVFYEHLLLTAGRDSTLFRVGEGVIICSLPFVAIGVAILMIGRIRYPHPVNLYLRGRKPITHLQWAVVIFAMIVFFLQTALVISFCGFALSGLGRWLLSRLNALRKAGRNAEPPVLSVTTPTDAGDQTQ